MKGNDLKKFFAAIIPLLLTTSATAQEVSSEVNAGVASVKQKNFDWSIETRIFAPNLNAQIKSTDFRFNGGRVDLRDDLNITRGEAPEILLRYKNFSLDWIHLHGAGKSSVDGNLNFGGKNFSGKLDSRSDLHFARLKVDKKIFSLMGTELAWHAAINAVGWHGTTRNGNSIATENFFAALPSVGASLCVRIRPRLDIYTQFSGMTIGRRAHFTDFESGIKYFPQKNFSISAGWRRIHFKLRHGGDLSNVTLNGAFVGMNYNF